MKKLFISFTMLLTVVCNSTYAYEKTIKKMSRATFSYGQLAGYVGTSAFAGYTVGGSASAGVSAVAGIIAIYYGLILIERAERQENYIAEVTQRISDDNIVALAKQSLTEQNFQNEKFSKFSSDLKDILAKVSNEEIDKTDLDENTKIEIKRLKTIEDSNVFEDEIAKLLSV